MPKLASNSWWFGQGRKYQASQPRVIEENHTLAYYVEELRGMKELTVGYREQESPENFAESLSDLVRKSHKAYIAAHRAGASFADSMLEAEYEAEIHRLVRTQPKRFADLYRSGHSFKGDKEDYTDEQILNAVAEAARKGVAPGNNRVYIISGNAYIAQNGYSFLLASVGVRDLWVIASPGEPTQTEFGADVEASWSFGGKKGSAKRSFWINKRNGSGWDLVEGKAKRKFYKWLYEFVTTISTPDDDPDIREGAIEVSGEVVEDQKPSTELAEQIRTIHHNMGDDEVYPEQFVAHLVANAPALEGVQPVPKTLEDVGKADPALIRYLANNWGPALKRYREQTKEEAAA